VRLCRLALSIALIVCASGPLACSGQQPGTVKTPGAETSSAQRSARIKSLLDKETLDSGNAIYIPPIPNAPFSATLEVISWRKLPDGSTYVLKLVDQIARDSHGRTYGETRRFAPESVGVEPPLVGFTIDDPVTGLTTFLNPQTRKASQVPLRTPPHPFPYLGPPGTDAGDPRVRRENIGDRTVDGLNIHGVRIVGNWSANAFNEYWYSPDLSVPVFTKYKDSMGERTFTVSNIDRREPDPSMFAIPADYTIVGPNSNTPQAPAKQLAR